MRSRRSYYATGWANRGWKSGRGKIFSSPTNIDISSGVNLAYQPVADSMSAVDYFWITRRGVKLRARLHLQPRSRINGGISPLPLMHPLHV